ncbi:DUF4649 family protein [Streptococcus suis]|nr:DUF4649 family protein [Streptococcus suis]
MTFNSYNSFVQSRQFCWHDRPDCFKMSKVTVNGNDRAYQGFCWNLYCFPLKKELSHYQ